ncbi:uncharacterized protein LOC130919309 [Corythoichthys intestinalis]|uniref:uncharacterized protein LOC130919309 n=1 Tax=Corythoichthys intestinalis TaxID=161448 RepID=UPI0025A649CF|nr:uncharacterized protein LOC130919309 [Corythoichthys intestinalis]
METETYSIKAEVILPMVQKYFERILPAQWSMLAAGTIDSATQVTLADMCTDITQKLCADTIRVIVPEFKKRADRKRMKLKVEGGLSGALASALGFQEQQSKSSQKLDALFKRELSQRANHALSMAAGVDGQPVPLVYILGTFTKVDVLAKMVLLACSTLKVYLSKMAIYTKCFRPCWRQKSRQEPSRDSKCGNACVGNREETTEAVMNILRKWTDSQDESLSLRTSRELKKTAAEILEAVINDLHYPDPLEEGRGRSSTPHFNLGLIKDQLSNFFESCALYTSADEASRKHNFLNFGNKTFKALSFELQKVRCRCMRMSWEEEICLPGSVPPIPLPESELGFQGVRAGLEALFRKVVFPAADTTVDVDTLRPEADEFLQDLVDKIYRYMTTNRITVRSATVWRGFSESLVLEVDEENMEDIKVLHKMVEDTATKFVQQQLLWLKMEPLTRGTHADQVYGCLNDIDALITGTLIPQNDPVVCLQDRVGPWPKTTLANEVSVNQLTYSQRYAWASSQQPPNMEEDTIDTPTPIPLHRQEFVVLDDIWN